MIRFLTKTILLFGLLSSLVIASDDAGVESPFSAGAGARSLGMGGGFTSLANDAGAMYYNPAGLSGLTSQEISLMYMSLLEDSDYSFGSWVYPTTRHGGFGFSFMRVGTGGLERTNDYITGGEFGYTYFQMLAGYGTNISDEFSFGLTVKLVNQSLDQYSDYGVGLDIGSMFRISDHFQIGLIARDFIPAELKLKTVKESVPTSFAGGVSLVDLNLSESAVLTSSIEFSKIERRSTAIHAGAEVVVDNLYSLRMGYDKDNLAFGVGYKYERLGIDYAYRVMDVVDDSHRFSLTFQIGKSIKEKMEATAIQSQSESNQLLEDERQRQFNLFKGKADQFYRQFRLDSALTYYQRALAFDEKNQAIIGTIAAIEEAFRYQENELSEILRTEQELQSAVERYLVQAETFIEKKYYLAAGDLLDLVLDIDPKNSKAMDLESMVKKSIAQEISSNLKIAEKAESEDQYFQAVSAYTRVLELDPNNKEIQAAKERIGARMDRVHQLNLGIEFFEQGKLRSAARRFRAVLAIDPNDKIALEYLLKTRTGSQKIATLEDIQKDRKVWQMYVDGLRHMRNKEYKEAVAAWNNVLKVYPTNVETRNNLEQAKLRLKAEDANK